MDQQQAKDLLSKYAAGRCTPEEKAWVESWYLREFPDTSPVSHEEIMEAMDSVRAQLPRPVSVPIPAARSPIPAAPSLVPVAPSLIPGAAAPIRRIWPRVAAAAIILLIGSLTTLYLTRSHKTAPVAQAGPAATRDIPPALNEATLTLANGQKIPLSKFTKGESLHQGNASIGLTADSTLTYSGAAPGAAPGASGKMTYNTLSTVRGERAPYPLLLADGTRVWLDAASSITFPVVFAGNSREVTVTGQAYFEVKHDQAHPFRVIAGDQRVEDIGTRFNINAFEDEPAVITTLVEGSVRVGRGDRQLVLRPGQMAVSAPGRSLTIKDADAEEALSWKNGYFYFNHEALQSVLRKISRWYNVTIEYPPGQPIDANYWGTMSRDANLSVVLNRLEVTGDVRFRITGNKIVVSKK